VSLEEEGRGGFAFLPPKARINWPWVPRVSP
jgi:hypothetical protein